MSIELNHLKPFWVGGTRESIAQPPPFPGQQPWQFEEVALSSCWELRFPLREINGVFRTVGGVVWNFQDILT